MEEIVALFPEPSVLQVILSDQRIILKTVMVLIVMTPLIFKVGQQFSSKTLVFFQVHIGIHVGFQPRHGVAIYVHRSALRVFWLHVFHIYLSCHGLIAVLHRAVSL